MFIKNFGKILSAAVAVLMLAGCSTWSTGTVAPSGTKHEAMRATSAVSVTISPNDTKRKYLSLGDITVTVNKTTIFNQEPTKEQVNEKLKEKAAELGADAVILVRYGNLGVSPFSWGSLEGKGRAIKYK